MKLMMVRCPACKQMGEVKPENAKGVVTCPECATNFDPQLATPAKRPMFPYWAWALVFVFVLIWVGIVNFWVAMALAGLALLAGIFVRLGKIASGKQPGSS